MSERMFPIQSERGAKPHPIRIPWSVAEKAFSAYSARYGRDQSLERLAERGGFGPGEMDLFLPGWRDEVAELTTLRTALVSERAVAEAALTRMQAADAALAAVTERATMWEEAAQKRGADVRLLHEGMKAACREYVALEMKHAAAETRAEVLADALREAVREVEAGVRTLVDEGVLPSMEVGRSNRDKWRALAPASPAPKPTKEIGHA